MGVVERLLTAGLVAVAIEDPTSTAARFCIESYFAELDSRFDAGFDPSRSISADAEELSEPAGLLLVARLRGEPIGCGALKLHGRRAGRDQAHVGRAEPRAGSASGRRILAELEDHARRRGVGVVRLETNRALSEAERPLPLGGLRRGRGLQRRALRPPLVREAPSALRSRASSGSGRARGASRRARRP